jgi:hypothetical protein
MYTDDHAGHTTCGLPDCRAFHLFCPDCGGRRHTTDAIDTVRAVSTNASVTDTGPERGAVAVEAHALAGVTRGGEHRLARPEGQPVH